MIMRNNEVSCEDMTARNGWVIDNDEVNFQIYNNNQIITNH